MSQINLVGQNVLGYTVKEHINSGSFGSVYRVEKTNVSGRYIRALKHICIPNEKQYLSVLNSMGGDVSKADNYFAEMLKGIVSEIQILNSLSETGSEHIVRYYENDIIETESPKRYDIFILMEYLTPFDEYYSHSDFSVRDVVQMGLEVLKGLKVCHEKGVIHRDIKDENIFVSENGTYKIGDFGVSKVLKGSARAESMKGTPNYLAPEVYLGKESYTVSVDLYSLGIVLYRLLNYGRNPFLPKYPQEYVSEDEEKAFDERMSGKKPDAPSLGGEKIGEVIVKAISDRLERYQSAEEFLRDLENAIKETDPEVLKQSTKAVSENLNIIKPNGEKSYRGTMADDIEPTRVIKNGSIQDLSANKHLFDTMGESKSESESDNSLNKKSNGKNPTSDSIKLVLETDRVIDHAPEINESEKTEKPSVSDIFNRIRFLLPLFFLLIGIITYFVVVPKLYGQVISFIDWIMSDPQNIIDTLRDPSKVMGKTNMILAMKVFWYLWLAGFVASLYYAGKYFQNHTEPVSSNAILRGKEPYYLAMDISALLKESYPGVDDLQIKQFIQSIEYLEEHLSAESDFGYGKEEVIKCENNIARQLNYLKDSVPYILSGNKEENLKELNKAAEIIKSLLRKRTELKKR